MADGLPDDQTCADIAAAFEEAVVDTLVIKSRRALESTGLKRLVIAGGVSANSRLREKLHAALGKMGAEVFYARHEFCTDNGAMIAYAGCQRLLRGVQSGLAVEVTPRWPSITYPAWPSVWTGFLFATYHSIPASGCLPGSRQLSSGFFGC